VASAASARDRPVMAERARTYTNPVHAGYFADPFVFRHEGTFYAVGTGATEAEGEVDAGGLVFPLLRSDDFVTWTGIGSALVRPDPALGDTFWAPEVAYERGVFYLYYSVGIADQRHQLRVATSEHPAGPYRDCGVSLIDPSICSFAIDAHPFRDVDGSWYLFYARDFLDAESPASGSTGSVRAGTALMAQRMATMTELVGGGADPGVVVLRARHDWQRFLADRPMYGEVYDWHTLEGPTVWRHGGRYYCFYSAGRWESASYGVDYGVADRVLGPYSDAGNAGGPRVLATVPDRVLGPGHNSIVIGPDGVTPYFAYHAWDPRMTARRFCLDRLSVASGEPRCEGPTSTAQVVSSRAPPRAGSGGGRAR
jgi:beta-xylosidase